MLATNIPLGKQGACLIAIVDHPNQPTTHSVAFVKFKLSTTSTCKQEISLADDDATLTSPAPGMSPSHQEMEDTSSHAAASFCPNLKDGIEASNTQCLKLSKLLTNVTIEEDEEVSIFLIPFFTELFILFLPL